MDKAKWAAQNGDVEELKQEVSQPGVSRVILLMYFYF